MSAQCRGALGLESLQVPFHLKHVHPDAVDQTSKVLDNLQTRNACPLVFFALGTLTIQIPLLLQTVVQEKFGHDGPQVAEWDGQSRQQGERWGKVDLSDAGAALPASTAPEIQRAHVQV